MDDLISRQAAIDALGERPMVWMDSDYEIAQRNQYDMDKLAIETVPSVQPEHNSDDERKIADLHKMVNYLLSQQEQRWIPCSERLPSKEECKKWIDKNVDGIGYLYPCLVTRYSSINPDRTKNNPYVAKHYFDGEDFLNASEEVCNEYIIAWMPLPEPYMEEGGEA